MTVCLLALAAPISSSRRRLHAVHRHDDLGVSDSNSSAGEIIAGGWLTDYLSSEPGEELSYSGARCLLLGWLPGIQQPSTIGNHST